MAEQDILSDLFSTLRLHSGLYFRAELAGTWAVEVPAERRRIRFHLVRQGRCWVIVEGSPPIRLEEGDLAVIPNGAVQVLADDPARPPAKLADVIAAGALGDDGVLRAGEGSGLVRLLCGFCDFDEAVEHPVAASLPPLLVLSPRDLGDHPWMAATLRLMALESDLSGQGRDGILSRLIEVAFIQAVRRLCAGGASGYLAALADPRLSKALVAIHGAPDQAWTLTHLARIAGLSRAVFAERFAAAVGLPPNAYLTRWRLMKARRLLRETTLATDEIGRRCGYQSLPSFTRRFKAIFGVGPGAYRRKPG